jgi:hypothetical protein
VDLEVGTVSGWQRIAVDLESWRSEGRGNMKHMEASGTR